MWPPLLRRTHWLSLSLLTLLPPLAAADPAPRSTVDDQDAVNFRGIFDFQLPKIIRPESLRLTFSPQFGDVLHRDYVRFRTGFRYAFTKHIEASAEIVPFFDNAGGDGRGGFGLAEYRFGTKVAWHNLLRPYVDTAFGATVSIPSPGAPEELNIGTARCMPYVTFSRDLHAISGLNAFLTLGYEFFDSDPDPARVANYRPEHDNLVVTPGVVLHRAPWYYTLATTLRTTALDGPGREYLSLSPSISYEVPSRWFPSLPGRLVVGVGYEAIFFSGEVEHRVSTRVRWDVDWLKKARDLGNGMLGHLPWHAGTEKR